MDFTTWTWAYTNDTGHPLVIDGVPLDPGARRVFTGVAADSATGALLFLDSYNSVAAQLPAGAMALVPDMEEALRQAHEQAAAYDEGEKRLIVAPDQPTAFDPAAKDGPLDHPEQPADLVDRTQPPPNTAAEIGTQPPPPPGELPPKNPPPGEKEQRAKDEDKAKATGADPVDLFTGEFFLEKVDFELPSVGFPFVFIRTYKSGRSFFGPLGYNWDHSYNRYLRRLTTGAIAVNTGRLQEDIYRDSGDGVLFDAPRGVFAKLEQQPSASQYEFVLTTTGGVTQSFATPAGWSARSAFRSYVSQTPTAMHSSLSTTTTTVSPLSSIRSAAESISSTDPAACSKRSAPKSCKRRGRSRSRFVISTPTTSSICAQSSRCQPRIFPTVW